MLGARCLVHTKAYTSVAEVPGETDRLGSIEAGIIGRMSPRRTIRADDDASVARSASRRSATPPDRGVSCIILQSGVRGLLAPTHNDAAHMWKRIVRWCLLTRRFTLCSPCKPLQAHSVQRKFKRNMCTR